MWEKVAILTTGESAPSWFSSGSIRDEWADQQGGIRADLCTQRVIGPRAYGLAH
jgi:hypothetical protein